LKLFPLGVIAGKFALEATPVVCESKRKWSLEEALFAIRPGAKSEEATPAQNRTVVNGLTEKGEFTVYYLAADRYFLEPRLPNENWYVKAITAPASTSVSANTKAAAARGALMADISRNGITLKAGEKITGVVATIGTRSSGRSFITKPWPRRMKSNFNPAGAGKIMFCDLIVNCSLAIERSPAFPVHDYISSSHHLEGSDSDFQFKLYLAFASRHATQNQGVSGSIVHDFISQITRISL